MTYYKIDFMHASYITQIRSQVRIRRAKLEISFLLQLDITFSLKLDFIMLTINTNTEKVACDYI